LTEGYEILKTISAKQRGRTLNLCQQAFIKSVISKPLRFKERQNALKASGILCGVLS